MIGPRTVRESAMPLALMAALLLATFAVYWPGLTGPLLLDDLPQLNALIADSAQDPATVTGNYIVSSSGPLGRPVAMATFIGDALAHGPDIWWWKYGNLLYHLIGGLLLFWLTALLIEAARDTRLDPWLCGAVVAGLWLLHPLNVSTVLYTVQRMTELSTLFVFAGLVAYVKGRLLHARAPLAGWCVIALGFAVFFPLAAFSKESALLFPVYCTLIEFFVLRFRDDAAQRQVRWFHGGLVAAYTAAAVLLLIGFQSIVLDAYAARDFTLGERVLTQFRVVVTYLSQLLIPLQARMGFFHDGLAVSTGLFSPITTIVSMLVVIGSIAGAWLLRARAPLVAFGVLLFFASHALESTIFGLELMYEHRNYTGSFGVMLAIVAGVPLLLGQRRAWIALAAVGIAGFAALTWQRAATWSAPATMYQYMYSVHPESPRLNIVFTNVFASAGDFNRARVMLANVDNEIGAGLHALFLECLEHQQPSQQSLARAMQADEGIVNGHATSSVRTLVDQVIGGQCRASSASLLALLDHLLESRTRSDADKRSLFLTRARLLERDGRIDASVESLLAAQAMDTEDARASYLAADALIRHGDLERARQLLQQAFAIEQEHRIRRKALAERVYSNLATQYARQGETDAAIEVYGTARVALPRRSFAYSEAAALLIQLGRVDEARQTLQQARQSDLIDRPEFQYRFDELARIAEGRPL